MTKFRLNFEKNLVNDLKNIRKNLVNDWKNIIAHRKESERNKASVNKFGSLQKHLRVWGGSRGSTPIWIMEENCNFFHYLRLKSFSRTETASKFYIINIGSSTHHMYPVWKRILKIWHDMKARELQKSLFSTCLVNSKNFRGTV